MWYEIVFVIEMDLETKMELLKLTDSYWDMLPTEIKETILKYKESQELIDRRESTSNRALCKQIRLYEQLRQKWQIGHIQCRPIHCNPGEKCECMRVYGFYHDLRGRIQKSYLGISIEHAMAYCDFRRVRYNFNGMDDEWILIGYGRASSC